MSPGAIMAWIPVARELYELGELIAKRVRARRAKRKERRRATRGEPPCED